MVRGIAQLSPLMVVHDLYTVGVLFSSLGDPNEANPVLIIDPYTVLPLPLSL